jgi:drug/metabolite transporter (DMT)-like permease
MRISSLPSTAYPLLAVVIWTGNTLVSKAAATSIAPATIAFYRWALAFLLLTPFLLRSIWRQRDVVSVHFPKLAVLGALGMGLYQGLAYTAAHSTTAINMGVVVALMPLLSLMLSTVLAGESLSAGQIGWALLSLAGLLVLTTHGAPLELLRGAFHVGDALMLVAVSSNALYGVLVRRWALPLSTWQQLYVQAGVGALLLLPFWILAPHSDLTPGNTLLVLYAAVPASIAAPFCWMTGLKRLGPARASMFMNLLPVLVALTAWSLLGERLHGYHAVGGLMALLGVWGSPRKTGDPTNSRRTGVAAAAVPSE